MGTGGCRGVCSRTKVVVVPYLAYKTGHKRCTVCAVFFKTVSYRCPCCNSKLRVKSR